MSILDHLKFDVRIMERNRKAGIISEEDAKRFLKGLKDASDNAASVEAQLSPVARPVPGRVLEEEEEL
ncbi:MAG: hypothetical protein GYA21_18245 [Myxococcales bacterium]|nr:hypothetical protein [Myxococcales bacterium]